MIYLDYNATTPAHPEVIKAMIPCFSKKFGNPSSFYRIGRETKAMLHRARTKVAACIGAEPGEIYFTAGGTESDNMAVRGIARLLKEKGNHIITSSVEHHAVFKTCAALEKEGFEVTFLPVDSAGRVDPDDLSKSITSRTILVSIMAANNETGVVQPVEEIGALTEEKNILFHTDAVQAAGKIPIDVTEIKADLLSLTGHKLYGPKGSGALYIKKGISVEPIITGGSHELNLRAGTENVAGIVGLAEAVRIAKDTLDDESRRLGQLRDRLEEGLSKNVPDICINGCSAPRVPNTSNITFMGVDGESILLHLDLKDIYASSGSACATGSAEPSHVLRAMGIGPREAQSSVRFSLGKETTEADIEVTVNTVAEVICKLRTISSV